MDANTFFAFGLGAVAGYIVGLAFYQEEINAGKAIVAAGKHAADVAVKKAHDVVAEVKAKAVAAINSL